MDFASAILAGLAKAVTLFAWVEERVQIKAFATVILSKAGEVMFVKFLDVLVLVKIVQVMVTVIAPHTSAHATPDGLVLDVISQTAPVHRTAMTVATVMRRLHLHNVRTAVVAGWDLLVLIRVSLESKFQWTVDSVYVGLVTQVRETLPCIIAIHFLSYLQEKMI